MSAITSSPRPSTSDGDRTNRRTEPNRRASTETKASFKTTEFFAYLAAVVGVLIAAGIVDESNAGGLGAKQAWLYVTILTVGYMVSRGFAKSGSRESYTADERS
jgi:hypothetical protein